VQLQSPGVAAANDPTNVPYYFEDEVLYDDRAPWPDADGNGMTLTRLDVLASGNDARSWRAGLPTPGGFAAVDPTAGDLNGDGAVDDTDIDMLCGAVRSGQTGDPFELDGDGLVDIRDQRFLVEMILRTSLGDANLDGKFNSTDFVLVFQSAEFEDAVSGNSGWSEGDWNCDGDFGTSDFVVAFQAGRYVAEAVAIDGDRGDQRDQRDQVHRIDLAGAITHLYDTDGRSAGVDSDIINRSDQESREQDRPLPRPSKLDLDFDSKSVGHREIDQAIRELVHQEVADRNVDELLDETDIRAFIA
jgi:hypothetical protein